MEEGLGLPPEPPTKSYLVRFSPLTFDVITRLHETKTKVVEGAIQAGTSATGSEEVAIH